MKFHAFHGVYPEEKILGGEYIVDIAIEADLDEAGSSDDLSQTINYEAVYQICKGVMQRPMELIESVLHDLATELMHSFSNIEQLRIKIAKLHPPLGGRVGAAVVEEEFSFVKECGRCGKDMICYSNDSCWCHSFYIPAATRTKIHEQYGTTCLCPTCLADYAKVEEDV